MTELMLFPLNSVVLPEGKMNLRIFEPRYKRMVKECCANDIGFGMNLASGRKSTSGITISTVGTMVKIIDFETLPDGLLGITVVGNQRFSLQQVWSEHDGLRKAKVEWLDNWNHSELNGSDSFLSVQLEQIYNKFPQLGALYSHRFFDDASWVAQRWLELLPLESEQFELLTSASSCQPSIDFLRSAIECPSPKETRQ
ncbi:LON peptidase substrate-binding domain-containing protein [Vibrio maerlii]|uniref:LON peptidase substrate-binding domain-containing protein n=1 Tax=Vibrio maerlii TaxID=2231648 RepID=UPI000E3C2854|nr:LON peptidase substrate-binding domain-containing protein [Vibrio maerlii]